MHVACHTPFVLRPRTGVILIVVLSLLTLFSVIGLTFVFNAQKEHTASLDWRQTRWEPLAQQANKLADQGIELVAQTADECKQTIRDGTADVPAYQELEMQYGTLLEEITTLKPQVQMAVEQEDDPAVDEALMVMQDDLVKSRRATTTTHKLILRLLRQ